MESESGVPRIPVGEWMANVFNEVNDSLGPVFDVISESIRVSVDGLTTLLQLPPVIVAALILGLLAWAVRDWKLGLATVAGALTIESMGQWDDAMQTLASVLLATTIALTIGIPLGVAAARRDRVSRAVRPVLDLMQTMPAFVWLIPVVTLFSIGVPAGVVATIVFALPPGVRLTELGIRQVDGEIVEAGHAFGGTPRQILTGIQLPLAKPTILAGVNQVIMLALSMAVIAGLVGGGGLGSQVMTSISRLDLALGFEAGLSVVILAIILDRITSSLGVRQRKQPSKAPIRPSTTPRVEPRQPAISA